jgi:hypothetical protein
MFIQEHFLEGKAYRRFVEGQQDAEQAQLKIRAYTFDEP